MTDPAVGEFLFDLPRIAVPTVDGRLFPVRRLYCIGRNYADHAKEMGADPKSEPPFFFQKPADAIQPITAGTVGAHPYPALTANYHFELELVVFLQSGGRDIAADAALAHVYGYAAGLDMTRRDRQQEMKDGRKPWEIGKSFDRSAPMGPIVPADRFGRPDAGAIALEVNGAIRQTADLADMIWSVAEQIAVLSTASALCAGDVIMTGTPAGVGAVVRGDRLEGKIATLPPLALTIV